MNERNLRVVLDLNVLISAYFFSAKLVQLNQTPQSLRDTLSNLGEEVPSQFIPYGIVRDEDDRVILGCAVGGHADYIVSGDNDLTVLKSYQNIPIVKPSEFLEILNPPVEERS